MRREQPACPADKEDMLWEAHRIIQHSQATGAPAEERTVGRKRTRGLRPVRRWVWFLLGSLCGGGSIGLLWFLLCGI